MTAILLVAGLTLLASFLCSLFEAALYSITPSQVELLVEAGGPGAQRLARLRADVEAPIAAILTVNTVAHTVGAAWCGAMVAEEYDSAAVGLFAVVFTVLVLALTEIVPKSLGVRHAKTLAPLIVWPLQLMIWSVFPVVWLARRAMGLLAGGRPHGPSEEEIEVLARMAAHGGAVRAQEHRWVANALRLDQVRAGDLRTPRTVVETLPADTLVVDAVTRPHGPVHSRIPITEGPDTERLVGLVHLREVYDAAVSHPEAGLQLRDLRRPLRFVPEGMPAHRLLDLFLRERIHLVAVADEFGGFEGVVTLEDVLEELLGEQIVDEHDQVEDMQAMALQRQRERLAAHAADRDGTPAGDDAARPDVPGT